MAKRIGLVSLGCPKNTVDAEIMLKKLVDAGYEIVTETETADIVIVNTCAFIESAKQESIDTILEMADFKEDGSIKKILVTGCLAERYGDEVKEQLPEVDGVIGIGANDDIVAVCDRLLAGEEGVCDFPPKDGLPLCGARELTTPPYTAYLKIAEGCSNHCSYCAIPAIRGPFRSRPLDDVVAEAETIAAKGVKELVLVAQDTSRYGEDLAGKSLLPELLGRLNGIEGLEWIRVLYCYPERITDELLDAIANNDKVCKYLDIPMQHADGAILRAMHRAGDKESLLNLVRHIREKVPGVAIRSTFICGFPGETDEAFTALSEFLNEAQLDRVGFFAYSREEGTPAYDLPDQVDAETAAHRVEVLTEQQSRIADEQLDAAFGATYDVLVEGYDAYTDSYYGRTYMDAPDIDNNVIFTSGYRIDDGDIVPVEMFDKDDGTLIGEAV